MVPIKKDMVFTRALAALLLALATVSAPVASSLPVGSVVAPAPNAEETRLLEALRRGGVVVLIRHSPTVPGIGDPPGFQPGDCSTQRNLSDAGRQQARRLGEWFESNRVRPASVLASPWCRAVETAMLAFGRSEPWPPLANLLRDRSRQDEHAAQVLARIAKVDPTAVDVLVSHGVTIDAFVNIYLQQGEMAVVRPALKDGRPTIEVVGRLLVP